MICKSGKGVEGEGKPKPRLWNDRKGQRVGGVSETAWDEGNDDVKHAGG